jgi:CRP-like cAMP-binding protein
MEREVVSGFAWCRFFLLSCFPSLAKSNNNSLNFLFLLFFSFSFQVLFRPGDVADEVYFLASGEVELTHELINPNPSKRPAWLPSFIKGFNDEPASKIVRLCTISQAGIVGEVNFFVDGRRWFTATAVSETTVYVLTRLGSSEGERKT